MGDIFISYASSDRPRAKLLADNLAGEGWSVWWDRTIPPGKTFDEVIEAELAAARCVIVIWSSTSVESSWVRAEAGEAMNRGVLIPVLMEEADIPLVFRPIQAADLRDWEGGVNHPGYRQLVAAIAAAIRPAAGKVTPDRSAPGVSDLRDRVLKAKSVQDLEEVRGVLAALLVEEPDNTDAQLLVKHVDGALAQLRRSPERGAGGTAAGASGQDRGAHQTARPTRSWVIAGGVLAAVAAVAWLGWTVLRPPDPGPGGADNAEQLAVQRAELEREQAAQRAAEEEARRQAEAQAAAREAQEREQAAKRAAEEEARRQAEAQAAAREAQEREQAAQRAAEEEARRQAEAQAQAAAREAQEREQAAQRAAEEEARREAEAQAAAREAQEREQAAKRAAEEEARREAEAQAAARETQEREQAAKRAAEEEARRQAEAQAQAAAREAQEREQAAKRAAEEEARREAEAQARARRERTEVLLGDALRLAEQGRFDEAESMLSAAKMLAAPEFATRITADEARVHEMRAAATARVFRIAILPFHTTLSCNLPRVSELNTAVLRVVGETDGFEVAFSFYRDPEHAALRARRTEIWDRGKPRPEVVASIAKDIGADGAYLAWIDCTDSPNIYDDQNDFRGFLVTTQGPRLFEATDTLDRMRRGTRELFAKFTSAP